LAKRLTENQKKEITKLFIAGNNINDLSEKFYCTELTISRNLKKILGVAKYKELTMQNKLKIKLITKKKEKVNLLTRNKGEITPKAKYSENKLPDFPQQSQFVEIAPLNYQIENNSQKDFSSIPISDIEFPKTVYMIVDKIIELEIKYLKDYPKWHFLSQEELKRKTIEIYHDLKIAKSFCEKEQRVIKVPNTTIFKIVAPILRSRGISRIVSHDKLIAL